MFPAVARAAYTVNRAYRMALGEPGGPTWEAAPQSVRDGMIRGVEYRFNNLEATPEDMHNAWVSDKLARGWMYGETESDLLKTHPNLVGWGSLGAAQSEKDAIFMAVVDSVLPLCQELKRNGELLEMNAKMMEEEQTGALLYIAAVVKRFGGETGIVHLTKEDMLAALSVELMRHDTDDDGLILKVQKPEAPAPNALNLGLPANS